MARDRGEAVRTRADQWLRRKGRGRWRTTTAYGGIKKGKGAEVEKDAQGDAGERGRWVDEAAPRRDDVGFYLTAFSLAARGPVEERDAEASPIRSEVHYGSVNANGGRLDRSMTTEGVVAACERPDLSRWGNLQTRCVGGVSENGDDQDLGVTRHEEFCYGKFIIGALRGND